MNLQVKPTKKQADTYRELYKGEATYVVFGGGAGGGKSWLLCEWLLVNCIVHPGTKWYIGREELKRLMSSTYVTWNKVCSFHNIPRDSWKLNGQYNYIEFTNGSRIDLLDLKHLPSDPMYERFGSLEYTGGAIEEAGEVDFLAFDVLKSRIGRHMNDNIPPKMLITCNPKKNWLYTQVYNPWKKGILPKEYAFIQSLYYDNPFTAESYHKQLSQISSKVNRERLMLGLWDYEEEDGTLFSYPDVEDMWEIVPDNLDGKYMTVDVARFGKDKTVIYVWHGLALMKVYQYSNQGLDVTAQKVKDLARQHGVSYRHIVIDEDGVGGGVVDLCRGVHGFMANSTPLPFENPKHEYLKPNYANLKTQVADVMAKLVEEHRIAVLYDSVEVSEQLKQELATYKIMDPDSDNKKPRLASKEEQKGILGKSPDYGDAFIMRGFFELKRSYRARSESEIRKEVEYQMLEENNFDPFSVI